MGEILNYVGLANLLFFSVMLFILINKTSGFDLKKHKISELAKFKKNGLFFNMSLFIFSVGQIIFALRVSQVLANKVSWITIPLFILGGLSLCLASIFTTNHQSIVHRITSNLSAICVGLGVIIVSHSLFNKNCILGTLNIGATSLLPISFLLRSRLTGARWELLLLGGVAIWNLTFSIPLLLS